MRNGTPTQMHVASIQMPSQAIAVKEYSGGKINPNLSSYSDNGMFPFQNHLGTSNFLFVDGHVKSMKPAATYIIGQINMWACTPTASDTDFRNALYATKLD